MDSLTDTAQLGAAWFAEQAGSIATAAGSAESQPAMVERSAPGGHMPPLLRRDEDEAYRVVEGEITFFVDGETVEAAEGDVVVAPAGSARTFTVESDTARWIVLTRVASLDRFLDFGLAISPPLDAEGSGWPSAGELAAITAIGTANGIKLLGPPGVLPGDRA